MSRTTRRKGCNDCVHAQLQHGENYLCVEKEMWVWPWIVDDGGELPECEFYHSSGGKANEDM